MAKKKEDGEPVVIKKYPNRRLYDTETSSYITLDDLCQRVKEGREFIVVDAKTEQDLTRQVLTQIIFEQETKGKPLLPVDFLRNVILFYDNEMHTTMQQYLDGSMQGFIQNQERMQEMVNKTFGDMSPMGTLEEMTRKNVEMFEKTMEMFNPFAQNKKK